jgi:hypothetical protein
MRNAMMNTWDELDGSIIEKLIMTFRSRCPRVSASKKKEELTRSHPFARRHSSWVDKNDQAPLQEEHHSGKYSVMFWGSISTMGRGALVVVQDTMDGRKYKKILREDLSPEATIFINRGIPVKVMHDNAPCHSIPRLATLFAQFKPN